MADFTGLPRNTELAKHVIDAQTAAASAKLERGLLGWIFGTRSGAPFNVASLTVVIGLITICATAVFGSDGAGFGRKEIIAAALNLVTLSLGYLFGKSQAKD